MTVLVSVGGYDGSDDLASVEVYEQNASSSALWSMAKGEMGTVRSAAGIAAVGNRVYYAGGSTGSVAHDVVESFVLTSNNGFQCDWRYEPSLGVARMALSLVANDDDVLWALGGYDESGSSLNTVDYLEAAEWHRGPPMREARCSFGALVVKEGAAIVALGGHGGRHGVLNSCELLDPRIGTWQPLPLMHQHRSCMAAARLSQDRWMVCGGHDGTKALATVELFDLRSGRWQTVESMPTARSGLAAATIDRNVWAIGGYPDGTAAGSNARALRCAELWDDDSQSWREDVSMNRGRTGPGAIALELAV